MKCGLEAFYPSWDTHFHEKEHRNTSSNWQSFSGFHKCQHRLPISNHTHKSHTTMDFRRQVFTTGFIIIYNSVSWLFTEQSEATNNFH